MVWFVFGGWPSCTHPTLRLTAQAKEKQESGKGNAAMSKSEEAERRLELIREIEKVRVACLFVVRSITHGVLSSGFATLSSVFVLLTTQSARHGAA